VFVSNSWSEEINNNSHQEIEKTSFQNHFLTLRDTIYIGIKSAQLKIYSFHTSYRYWYIGVF